MLAKSLQLPERTSMFPEWSHLQLDLSMSVPSYMAGNSLQYVINKNAYFSQ
jgi:hypothetical protein